MIPSEIVLIVGFHCYENEDKKIDAVFSLIKENFVAKGIPVVLSEFGMAASEKDDITQKRLLYISKVVSEATKLGIVCFWWDNGGRFSSVDQVDNFALLDRYNKTWYFPRYCTYYGSSNRKLTDDICSPCKSSCVFWREKKP